MMSGGNSRLYLTRRAAVVGLLMGLWGPMCPGAEPQVQVPSYNQFSPEDEAKVGAMLTHDFESSHEILSNQLLDHYLDDLVKRLGKSSRRPELTYTLRLVNSDDIAIYSFPGGTIYITRGVLDFVDDESELASLTAHEVGHIAGRHILNRLSLELKSKSLWSQATQMLPLLDSAQLQQAFQKAGMPMVALAGKQYDKSNENEADLLAVYNLVRAGWTPLGQVRVLSRLQNLSAPQAAAMAAYHPEPGDRSRIVSAEIRTIALSSSLDENSVSFRLMKTALPLLPKPGRH
jgi:predicted Zn-dependent protease